MPDKLTSLFRPNSVAIVGASDSPLKISYCCVESLTEGGFAGRIFPVNPSKSEVRGLATYRAIEDIPCEVDMAVIVVPAHLVPAALEGCARKGIGAAVIITAGFKETGTESGIRLQNDLVGIADRTGIRVLGPNTVGLVSPHVGLNATFMPSLKDVGRGGVAMVCQSGGVCAFLLHAAINEHLGVSLALSLGNRANLDFGDIIEYLDTDPQTRAIALHVEGVDNPMDLMEVAGNVARRKPIVVYKPEGSFLDEAAYSHTGALAGSYQVFRAAFEQAGIVFAEDTGELLDVAKAMAFYPPPRGNRVAILSLQAGPGIIASSKCQRHGLLLADLSPRVREKLTKLAQTPSFSRNPIDLAGGFGQSVDGLRKWQDILRLVLEDESVDAVVLSTVYHTLDLPFVESVVGLARDEGLAKPLIMCRDSPLGIARGEIAKLEENGIPVYPSVERAVRALAGLVRYGHLIGGQRASLVPPHCAD
jgi:acyl-CoA synthetase (NDP forming)